MIRSPSRQQPPPTSPSRHSRRRSGVPSAGSNISPLVAQDHRSPLPQAPTSVGQSGQPSPNYFGLTIDTAHDGFASSGARHVRQLAAERGSNASSGSQVRSAAASSPRVVPLDDNSEFAAFRRQSEAANGTFNLNRLADYEVLRAQSAKGPVPNSATTTTTMSSPVKSPDSSTTSKMTSPISPRLRSNSSQPLSLPPADNSVVPPPQNKSPKRMLSEDTVNTTNHPRRNSPASFTDHSSSESSSMRSDRIPRGSLPPSQSSAVATLRSNRAETLPATTDGDEGPQMATPQHVVSLMEQDSEDMLLLDLRVATQYAKSRIAGALNLCIPTTLLKRATFNVHKLTETFKNEEEKRKFKRWKHSRYLVVYDASSVHLKDATICVNTLKKFEREGWQGESYILRGGFDEFSRSFSKYVVRDGGSKGSSSSSSSKSPSPDPANRPAGAAVVGGCPMPPTRNAANPFFGNIRQNMDLIGGVGQLPVKRPTGLSSHVESEMPAWLRQAADEKDDGKAVSDKFLSIERREQKRMQEALSGNVKYVSPQADPDKTDPMDEDSSSVQIAGIEKGSKNRYPNIWPYEHSRVKLEDVPDDGCDYVNANYIRSPLTNKRYIATQGPIPATFNDFWKVVWQQDVRVIVMLTAEKEGGQVKAHNYWSERRYGPLELTFLSEHRASLEPSKIHRHRDRPGFSKRRSTNPTLMRPNKEALNGSGNGSSSRHGHRQSPSAATPSFFSPKSPKSPHASAGTPHSRRHRDRDRERDDAEPSPFVSVRKFSLSHTHEPFERPREITQLQYSSWPDFGAPAHPAHLLGLVEQCDAVVRSTSPTLNVDMLKQRAQSQSQLLSPSSRPQLPNQSRHNSNDFMHAPDNETRVSEAVKEAQDERPIIVHCSAGCGRTGTFCTVDTVVDVMKRQRAQARERAKRLGQRRKSERGVTPMDLDGGVQDVFGPSANPFEAALAVPSEERKWGDNAGVGAEVDGVDLGEADGMFRDDVDLVEKTVEGFRLQRLSMVQSLRQFVLCYESILEWLCEQQPRTA